MRKLKAGRRGNGSKRRLSVERLEARQLLSADLEITGYSQLLIELVNRARANPAGEAALYGINLNQGLPAGTITPTPKQPLAPHQALVDAAMAHSADMLDRNYFSHNSPPPNSTTPSDRAIAAGYPVGAGENIAYGGSTGPIDPLQGVYARHQDLFLSPGHRQNLLHEPYREMGTGVQHGVFTSGGTNFNVTMVTEKFGSRGGNHFITGVAFDDSVNADNFYNVGEGLGGIVVQASLANGTTFQTTTGPSGGYSLQVPNGTYNVTFVQPGTGASIAFDEIIVSGLNVKVDLNEALHEWQSPLQISAESLLISGNFAGQPQLQTTAGYSVHYADAMLPIDPQASYRLFGTGRAGNDEGGQFQASNRQYFGFASYDADQQLILPQHVLKFGSAVDTRLAATLRPGDTHIVLHDATGWANAGAAHQRSFAWYGYQSADGFTYADYTYTQNVATDFVHGIWNPGGITGNTIQLRQPWSGPEIVVGTAVRNATSGGTFNYVALSNQALPNTWTDYSVNLAGVGTSSTQFRPGTAYIRPVVLANYHSNNSTLVRWRNIGIDHAGNEPSYQAGATINVRVPWDTYEPAASFQWSQLAGPSVTFQNPTSSTATVLLPASEIDYSVNLRVTMTVAGQSTTSDLTIDVNGAPQFQPVAVLDQATFAGQSSAVTALATQVIYADHFIPIDPQQSYQLSGQLRSGNDTGGQFHASNRQYFGFASYDADQLLIQPIHVSRFGSASDTYLTATLRPGDTQIHLENASGWSNSGAAHQRSLAWYGYADSSGYVYDDFTYTRNVAFRFTHGMWNAGGITGNTITLREPWQGPVIAAGTAIRNATSGSTFNYAALANQTVPATWNTYQAVMQGTGTNANQFRPGTAYIKPIILANYHGASGNLLQWRDIRVGHQSPYTPHVAGTTVRLLLDGDIEPAAPWQWTQLAGPTATLSSAQTAAATLTLPASELDYQIVVRVSKQIGGQSLHQDLTVWVSGNPSFQPVAYLNVASFNGSTQQQTLAANQIIYADDFVPVNPLLGYRLTGDLRTGNDSGGQFHANNRQYFGFASYDADQLLIQPVHVMRFGAATDTRLAAPLVPGQTQIVLENAAGWANSGAGHQRSFAWYGYADASGHVYDDYTYTRNVAVNFTHGMWNSGGITGNVITLREPWSGPALPTGIAVRNATSGGTFNYAALSNQPVPQQWTTYQALIQGTGLAVNQFRPGTAYIKPILLANYHGASGNLIRWENVRLQAAATNYHYAPGTILNLGVTEEQPDLSASYQWVQVSGPPITIENPNQRSAQITLPALPQPSQIRLRLSRTIGGQSVFSDLTVNVSSESVPF